MKNKFVLTEEESKRILSLHKKKIQEEREEVDNLDEDDGQDVGQSTGRVMAGSGSGAATGAIIGAIAAGSVSGGLAAPAGAALGAVIGTGVGALAGWMTTGGGYSERVLKLVKFCKAQRNNLGKPVNSIDKLNNIADNIRGHVDGIGRTEEVLIARDLRALKTIPDFCAMIRIYSQRYNENWYNAIDGDIDMDTEWRDFVWIPLSELAKKTKKIEDGGKVKGKCANIINYYVGKGYKKITVERYRELANDKTRKRAYKFCPETKQNLFFAKYIGGNNNGGDDGGDGGGGGRRVTYPFDYNTILAAINQKCKGGGGGGDTNTPEDTDVINPFGQGSEEKQVITVTDKVYDELK
jgi:hypothetical protein